MSPRWFSIAIVAVNVAAAIAYWAPGSVLVSAVTL